MDGLHPASSRCLHCHRQIAAVAASCLHCGRAVVGSRMRSTWSLHPRFVALEGAGRTLVLIFALCAWFLVMCLMHGSEPTFVFLLGFVISGAVASWMVVSGLRRWETTRLARIFAALAFGIPGLFLLPRSLAHVFGGEPGAPVAWGLILLNTLEFAAVVAVWMWGIRVDAWKERVQREPQPLPLSDSATPARPAAAAPWSCLYCHRPVAQGRRCAACGKTDMPSLHRIYWTLDRRAMRFEFVAKALIIVLCIGLGVLMVPRSGTGTGGGWIIVFPAACAVALWETASKLTRHVPLFHARLFWSLTGWIAGGMIALYMGACAWGGTPPEGGFIDLGTVVLGAVALGTIIWHLAPVLERWKARRRSTPRPMRTSSPRPDCS